MGDDGSHQVVEHSHQPEEPKARWWAPATPAGPGARLHAGVCTCPLPALMLRRGPPYLQREAPLRLSPFPLPHPPFECRKYFFF